MHKRDLVVGGRFVFGLLTLVAVAAQLIHLLKIPGYNVVNFFSFFTIESNIFAGLMLIVTAILVHKKRYIEGLQMWRGAATLYMIITGIVYSLLLANADVDTPIPWVNAVLHYFLPMVMFVDWLFLRPRKPITFSRAWVWLIFPVGYLIYSLVRGSSTGWYPYPFLNPTEHGYGRVVVMSVVIALVAVGLTWVLVRISGLARSRR